MEIIVCDSKEQASHLAAHVMKNQIVNLPSSVLGFATGSTPLEMYKKLIQLVGDKKVPVDKIKTFNLDEYVGVSKDHPGSYALYMKENIYEPLGLSADQTHIPNGAAEDVAGECEDYEKLIEKQGPINLQILGIGQDGHIGFNEPGSSLGSRTRLKTLTQGTREVNSRFFSSSEETPKHVITMGIQSIMDCEKILLLAFGEGKARAVQQMVEGAVTASCPASVLQFHPKVKVFLDPAASKELKSLSYYKEVFEQKPSWQMKEFV